MRHVQWGCCHLMDGAMPPFSESNRGCFWARMSRTSMQLWWPSLPVCVKSNDAVKRLSDGYVGWARRAHKAARALPAERCRRGSERRLHTLHSRVPAERTANLSGLRPNLAFRAVCEGEESKA